MLQGALASGHHECVRDRGLGPAAHAGVLQTLAGAPRLIGPSLPAPRPPPPARSPSSCCRTRTTSACCSVTSSACLAK